VNAVYFTSGVLALGLAAYYAVLYYRRRRPRVMSVNHPAVRARIARDPEAQDPEAQDSSVAAERADAAAFLELIRGRRVT
jgi:hypothetical protein